MQAHRLPYLTVTFICELDLELAWNIYKLGKELYYFSVQEDIQSIQSTLWIVSFPPLSYFQQLLINWGGRRLNLGLVG